MRRLFTIEEARRRGLTHAAVLWSDHTGGCRRVVRGVYGDGPDDPTPLDRERGLVLARSGVARGHLAGVLLELDSVTLDGRPTRRRELPPERIILRDGLKCANGLQTLIDLAGTLDDDAWEQALESVLRKKLTSIAAIEAELPAMATARTQGVGRIRRVLAIRHVGARATESLLETLMVQLARDVPCLGHPTRQLDIYDRYDCFVARVDLCWPELGLFIELDGQQHKGQPVYDAIRETSVTAATGWLCGRFTWTEVVHYRTVTTRRFGRVVDQARRRPMAGQR